MAAAKKKRSAIPQDFSALLSTRGRKLPREVRGPVIHAEGLLDGAALSGVLRELDAQVTALETRDVALPPANSATAPFADRLPLVERRSVLPVEKAPDLVALISSASFHAFAETLVGSSLEPSPQLEVFAFSRDGYVGPQVGTRGVRIDLTLSRAGAHQLLVHEAEGHLSSALAVAKHGTVLAMRLPHWHFTTPLQTRSPKDRRWVVRATFQEPNR